MRSINGRYLGGAVWVMKAEGICALCRKQAKLQRSHIIPDFVYAWMKSQSPNHRLIATVNPRYPVQQGLTAPLLCFSCEQRFGPAENMFAKRIFKPFQTTESGTYPYGEWLRKYAVSQSFRTALQVSSELFRLAQPMEHIYLERALTFWRAYLLGDREDPGPYEHHLWFFNVRVKGAFPPQDIRAQYLSHGADAFFRCQDGELQVYTKLPKFVLWSTIHPNNAPGWINTRIEASGEFIPNQRVFDPAFHYFLAARTEHAAQLVESKLKARRP